MLQEPGGGRDGLRKRGRSALWHGERADMRLAAELKCPFYREMDSLRYSELKVIVLAKMSDVVVEGESAERWEWWK